MIITIITIVFILSATFIAFTKPKLLYFLLIFFASWYSLFIDIGLQISIYRLIIIIFLFCLPVYLSLRKNAIKFPSTAKYLLIFVCYAVAVTLMARFFVPESRIAGFTRGEGRWIFQIVMLFISVTPVFLPLLFLKKIEDIKTVAKVFIISTVILCILGWIQSLAFYFYRAIIFPVYSGGLTSGIMKVIDINLFGMTFHRMHSLGGEPKHFAATVVVALLLLIIFRMIYRKGSRFENLLIGFFLISLFMSFATSGFYIFFMGLILLIILSLFVKSLKFKFAFKSIAFLVTAVIIFFSIIISSGILSSDLLKKAVIERTIGRSPIEVFDAATLGFLANQPQYGLFGVGIGNVHLYAKEYLSEWGRSLAYNDVFVPNSGYLRMISEMGIVGLILFLFVYLIPIHFNFKYRRRIHDERIKSILLSLNIFAIFILIAYLMRAQLINYVFITLGLLYFLNYKITARDKHTS